MEYSNDPEVQKQVTLLQRVLSEQGYIVICRDKRAGAPFVNELITDDWGDTLNFLNSMQGATLCVKGTATFEEFMSQLNKYFPERAKLKQHVDRFYLVKVAAE